MRRAQSRRPPFPLGGRVLPPGSFALANGRYKPLAPLLIEAGGADDWTPARHREALVRGAAKAGAPIEIDVYEGAHHGFDGPMGKVYVRPEVRNPSSLTGWGATVGPNPEARARAIEHTTEFLARKSGSTWNSTAGTAFPVEFVFRVFRRFPPAFRALGSWTFRIVSTSS